MSNLNFDFALCSRFPFLLHYKLFISLF